MLVLLRLLFTGGLAYAFYQVRQNATDNPASGDLLNAFYLALCVVLGILTAVVWAPVIGAKVSDPLTGVFTDGSAFEPRNYLMRLIRWADDRRHRRLARWLCFLEGVRQPWWPSPFIVGMNNARPGSWLERVYAREVYHFNNAENCLRAFQILRRHGITPPPHPNPQVNVLLLGADKATAPESPPVPVPPAPPPPPLSRNPRIHLFDPPAPPPASDSATPPDDPPSPAPSPGP